MTDAPGFDLVIRGGTVATAADVFEADVAVRDGRVVALGENLPPAAREVDARGLLVLPGGVDPHAHIEQLSGGGLMNADTFETATRSAALGGTTSVISFAAQHRGMRLREVVADYAARAARGACVDHAFHLMVADPTPETLQNDIPALLAEGHRSIKVFMTYDRVKVDDEGLLDVLTAARAGGALVCVHAENHGLLAWTARRLVERGHVAPKFHAVSHPRAAEVEALERLALFAEFVDQPVVAFHVSTAEGAAALRRARGRGVKIHAETCPHYLLMTVDALDRPGMEAAKLLCSPPQRTDADIAALWRAIELGDISMLSSDHAPYRLDETGKLSAGPNPSFKAIANGMPGLEVRQPLLFDAIVSSGRMSLSRFVDLTSTTPARVYGLANKGSVAVGADADLALWDPAREVALPDVLNDNAGYNPFAGRRVRGWPVRVFLRGREIVTNGAFQGRPGEGRLLRRPVTEAMRPTGRRAPELTPATNFGADLS